MRNTTQIVALALILSDIIEKRQGQILVLDLDVLKFGAKSVDVI